MPTKFLWRKVQLVFCISDHGRTHAQATITLGYFGTCEHRAEELEGDLELAEWPCQAVASRTLQRSQGFIAECQADAPFEPVPRAPGGYEELLTAADVDAVYIPLPTGIQGRWIKRGAECGKHVVCEKPCAVTTEAGERFCRLFLAIAPK